MIDPSQGADSEAQKMARSMIALPVSETDSNHPTYSCLPHPDLTTPLLRYEQTRRDLPSVNLQSNSVQFVLSSSNIVFACPRECCSELWVVGLFHAKITRAVRRRAIYAGTFRTRLLLWIFGHLIEKYTTLFGCKIQNSTTTDKLTSWVKPYWRQASTQVDVDQDKTNHLKLLQCIDQVRWVCQQSAFSIQSLTSRYTNSGHSSHCRW